jgi:hypothetical protein
MKAFLILLLAALPVAALTFRGLAGSDPVGLEAAALSNAADPKAAAATAEKGRVRARTEKGIADGLFEADFLWPTELAELESLPPQSALEPLRNSWRRWKAARALVDELLALPMPKPPADAETLQAARRRWEQFQEKLQAAKSAASSPLATLADQRLRALEQQIARLEAQAEAAAAAAGAKTAFATSQFDQCRIRSDQWLSKYSGAADASLVEEIKTLRRRAEFQSEAERLRARVKAAATPAEHEAAVAAFLERFPQSELLPEAERVMLANCRRHLAKLRAEAAGREQLAAAQQAVRRASASLPTGFGQRLAQAAEILQKYPSEPVKAALRENVIKWLETSLPAKHLDEHPAMQEAETKEGRIVRGFFRPVSGPDGLAGFKRYDTWQEFQNPSADVGTWRSDHFASPPAPTLAERIVRRYNDQRVTLLAQADRREAWEQFAALCRQLETEWARYRGKPGADQQPLTFRQERELAEQVLSGTTLADLKKIWQAKRD